MASYAGVRPLYENNAASNSTVTRDYQFELDHGGSGDAPPILSIFGGKITTYRKLAEHALEKLPGLSSRQWTADEPLPGGDIAPGEIAAFVADMQDCFTFLPPAAVRRMARAYGTRMKDFLKRKTSINEMGVHIAGDLYAAELRYLMESEFATSAEDVLHRRSKLYLHLSEKEQSRVADWMAAWHASQSEPA